MAANRHRRRATRIVVVAAVLAITGMLLGWEDGSSDTSSHEPDAAAANDPVLLEGTRAPTGPVLQGHGTAAEGGATARGPLRVRVVNRHATPISGMGIALRRRTGAAKTRVNQTLDTDAHGWVEFADVPYDGTYGVAPATTFGGSMRTWHEPGSTTPGTWAERDGLVRPVDRPRLTMIVAALPLEVRVQAGDTGTDVRGLPVRVAPLLVGDDWQTGDPVRMWVRAGAGADGRPRIAVPADAVPRGYVGADVITDESISPAARALIAIVPLRAEAKLLVVPPTNDDWTYAVLVDGVLFESARVEARGVGGARVWGIPFRAGIEVSVLAHTSSSQGSSESVTRVWGRLTFDHQVDLERVVRLGPLDTEGRKLLAAHIAASRLTYSSGYGLAVRVENYLPLWDDFLKVVRRQIEVHVTSSDGKPAIGASVRAAGASAVTDSVGRATLTDVPVGKALLSVCGAGPSWQASADVADVKRQVIRIRVPNPARVDLEVVDREGRPVPFAAFRVVTRPTYPWFDLNEGVQRIDPYVGVDGRRRLHNLTPTLRLKIIAKSGALVGHRKIILHPGTTETVRIVLGQHAAPPSGADERAPSAHKEIEQALERWPGEHGK